MTQSSRKTGARARGRLWTAAALGALIGTAVTTALLIPRRPTVTGGGLTLQIAWVDDKGVLRQGTNAPGKAARVIVVAVNTSPAMRGDRVVWTRIEAALATGQAPLPEPLLSAAAAAVTSPENQSAMTETGAAGAKVDWRRVLAGQPVSWVEPNWSEVARLVALSTPPGLLVGAAVFGIGRAIGARRRPRGLCPLCGYSRSGLDEAALCPECGRAPATAGAPR